MFSSNSEHKIVEFKNMLMELDVQFCWLGRNLFSVPFFLTGCNSFNVLDVRVKRFNIHRNEKDRFRDGSSFFLKMTWQDGGGGQFSFFSGISIKTDYVTSIPVYKYKTAENIGWGYITTYFIRVWTLEM